MVTADTQEKMFFKNNTLDFTSTLLQVIIRVVCNTLNKLTVSNSLRMCYTCSLNIDNYM